MATNVEQLFESALLLSPEHRAELVEQILSTLDVPPTDIERAWAEEADRRIRAYRAGHMKAYSADQVLSELGSEGRAML